MSKKPVSGKSPENKSGNALWKNILLIALLILVLAEGVFLFKWHSELASNHQTSVNSSDISAGFSMIRMHDSKLIAPLLLANVSVECETMKPLKAELEQQIRTVESSGHVNTVSVYLRKLNSGEWISINGGEKFMPGSMLKLPIMITWLKQEELKPGVLGQKLVMPANGNVLPVQAYQSKTITPGKPYTVRELIEFMIEESDNNATSVLIQNLDQEAFKSLFTSVGLAPAELTDISYRMSATDISRFLELLYNSTFLGERLSDYALEVLTRSKFHDGLVKGLPPGIAVAHKFGEHSIQELSEFSESGIIYAGNDPYLMTVMTKGNDINAQTKLISELSLLAYQKQLR
jgi:beta-lactamase class A